VIEAGALPWLLEADNPSARYLALTGLLDRSTDDPEVKAARAAIPGWGPARAILDAQWPAGYWMHPGAGYSPKYRATVWQVIFLAQLGAPLTEAIDRACTYVLDHARLPDGQFTADKTAKGAILCLGGNLLRAMLRFGCPDPRIGQSLEVLATMAVRDGFRCRCNASPRVARHRDGLPCAWGAIKALGALAQAPAEWRSPAVKAAMEAGIAFLLSGDPAAGDYPAAKRPSALWQKLSFPLGYASDQLEALEVLSAMPSVPGKRAVGRDPRLAPAIEAVLSKQDEIGRWALGHTPAKTWARFGTVGRPNKWVTLRALRVLKHWEVDSRRKKEE
jgi:hypothetical protein